MDKVSRELSNDQKRDILKVLQNRFEKNIDRHKGINWADVQAKLETKPSKLWSLHEMELTGGEPDVVGMDETSHEYIFFDCSPESLKIEEAFVMTGRRLIPEKKINQEIVLWTWRQQWVLIC